ncbi:GNAT family N-acetyltransferase [Variovorax soli]|uniref:GNAT family N-acetyltransferase n=1 Tax=Variovorax soli TaxID=376815 RepID=UPI000839557A|nr:N-acetyltransferase [Variovorax soli]
MRARPLNCRIALTEFHIRSEEPSDIDAITDVTEKAFRHAPHTSHTEHYIVLALRRAGALGVSLVAQQAGRVVGHVAFSPVAISDGSPHWWGLGPVSVLPEAQGIGIGSALVRDGLAALRGLGAQGCVVLGEPDYYGRFGFRSGQGLVLDGVPPEYFQSLSLGARAASGRVSYHPAFDATQEGAAS